MVIGRTLKAELHLHQLSQTMQARLYKYPASGCLFVLANDPTVKTEILPAI
jgi:hypothetical protein